MPSNINGSETEGQKWATLQAWVKQACINAGIAITGLTDPLLSDINGGESEGIKWAKLQRWIRLLAENVSGGGGGSGPTVYTVTYTEDNQHIDVEVGRNSIVVIKNPDFRPGTSWSPTGTRQDGDIVVAYEQYSPFSVYTQVWTGSEWAAGQIPGGQIINPPLNGTLTSGVVSVYPGMSLVTSNITVNVTEPITDIVIYEAKLGNPLVFSFVQDSTGHSVTLPATWKTADGVPPVIDTRPNAITIVDLVQISFGGDYEVSVRTPQHRVQPVLVTTTRDIALADADRYLYTDTGSAVSLTVQADTLPLDSEIDLFQAGAGQITIVQGAGVSIISKGGNKKLAAQGSAATLKHVTANVWHLVGDLSS